MDQIKTYLTAAGIALALLLGGWSTWRTLPDSTPPAPPEPKPLVEPTDDRPLIVADKVVIPDRGMIRVPLKTIGAVRVVEYPGNSKHLQVEQFGNDVLLSRRSQVAENCYLGLQCEHKGVGPVIWILADMGLAPLPPPTPEPPEPKPPTPPKPPEPKPDVIPSDGPRVLIVFERTPTGAKLTPSQVSELGSAAMETYLNATCVKENGWPAWRMYDPDIQGLENAPPWWQDAMKIKADVLPRLIVTDGKNSFAGPLPDGGKILDTIKGVFQR
jgi:hypothetical protein